MEWNGSGGRGAWKSDLSSRGSRRSHLSYRGLCRTESLSSLPPFDLERRVTGVLTRLIDPTTDRIYLYRRPVLKRARFNWNAVSPWNTLVEQCGHRLDGLKEAARRFRREGDRILAEWNSVLFLKNLSRFVENRECCSVVVRIYVWKKEIIHPRVLSTSGVYNNDLEDKKQDK